VLVLSAGRGTSAIVAPDPLSLQAPEGDAWSVAARPGMDGMKDGSHLYEVERRAEHAARPGFRIHELQLSPTQQVPWHLHTHIQDTFYVLAGELRLFLREPKDEVRLGPGETYSVRPGRPHLVVNGGTTSATFLVLQGIGEYDFVPLV
jgi:quercetin dioxygenase-like cupin family protein